MKPLSPTIQNLVDLIQGGDLYVDKTARIYELVREYKNQYLFSRARCYGKSLTRSTFKAIFQGRRDPFTGTFIEKTDCGWPIHPVIHLNLGNADAQTTDQHENILYELITAQAELHDINLTNVSAAMRLMERINLFFAGIDYDLYIQRETYRQSIFYQIVSLVGIFCRTEAKTNKVRVDAAIELDNGNFLFEFKLDGPAAAAIAQMKEKGCAEQFRASGKPITLIGVSFNHAERNVGDWLIEPVPLRL